MKLGEEKILNTLIFSIIPCFRVYDYRFVLNLIQYCSLKIEDLFFCPYKRNFAGFKFSIFLTSFKSFIVIFPT